MTLAQYTIEPNRRSIEIPDVIADNSARIRSKPRLISTVIRFKHSPAEQGFSHSHSEKNLGKETAKLGRARFSVQKNRLSFQCQSR